MTSVKEIDLGTPKSPSLTLVFALPNDLNQIILTKQLLPDS